jgi:uncharacterized protein YciI
MFGRVELALLTYSYVEDMATRREPHRDGHLALIRETADAGRLLIAGATGKPPSGGVFVFADPEAAEDFVARDPYGEAGLITSHEIEPWTVVESRPLGAV